MEQLSILRHQWFGYCYREWPGQEARCVSTFKTGIANGFTPPVVPDTVFLQRCMLSQTEEKCRDQLQSYHWRWSSFCLNDAMISERECQARLVEGRIPI